MQSMNVNQQLKLKQWNLKKELLKRSENEDTDKEQYMPVKI